MGKRIQRDLRERLHVPLLYNNGRSGAQYVRLWRAKLSRASCNIKRADARRGCVALYRACSQGKSERLICNPTRSSWAPFVAPAAAQRRRFRGMLKFIAVDDSAMNGTPKR